MVVHLAARPRSISAGLRRGQTVCTSSGVIGSVGRHKYPMIAQAWPRAWVHVIPFFALPPEVRRIIYTTNETESLHMQLRKIIKTRGHFPSDERPSG